MNKSYNLKVLEVTNATQDMLHDLCKQRIINNDFLTIYVCTDLMADVLQILASKLKSEHEKEVIKRHIKIRVPFAYRKIRPKIITAFSLDE